jgi:hypothetical protein
MDQARDPSVDGLLFDQFPKFGVVSGEPVESFQGVRGLRHCG